MKLFRMAGVIVVLILVAGTFRFSSASSGDVNEDGVVNVFDALLVLQYSVGLYHPTNETSFKLLSDVAPLNALGVPMGDSTVNVFDALAILRHAVNLDDWTGLPKPPASPTNLKATPGNASITFTWDNVASATGYNLYYGTTSGDGKTNRTILTGVTSPKTVSGLTNGIPYYAVVTAVNADGESIISSEVSAKPFVSQDLASLIVGIWTFDASQSIWPGDSTAGFTGTMSFSDNNTFTQIFYYHGFIDGNMSGTFTITNNNVRAIVTSSINPSEIGQVLTATLSLTNNNNTLIMVIPGGEREVYNRQ